MNNNTENLIGLFADDQDIFTFTLMAVVVVFADLLDCCIDFALAATGDENVGTLVDEPLCCGEAYAAASSCDDCDFSFKLFHDLFTHVDVLSL
jgi:hypothetical protein